MMAKRKRAPGGGRKASGPFAGKTERFSTRIMRDTREALEREATLMGVGVSQAAERLLRLAIQTRRDEERDQPLRALCFLVEQLAIQCSLKRDGVFSGVHSKFGDDDTQTHWRTNPFIFRSLQAAIGIVMDRLLPAGSVEQPKAVQEFCSYFNAEGATPEEWGETIAQHLLIPLLFLNADGISRAGKAMEAVSNPKLGAAFENFLYGFSDAQKALQPDMEGTRMWVEVIKPKGGDK